MGGSAIRAYRQNEVTWLVEGDTDGDGEADFLLAVVAGPDTDLSFDNFLP